MIKRYTLKDVCGSDIFQRTLKEVFGKGKFDTLVRPHSYIFKLNKEPADKVTRIILLPPRGFTANSLKEMNSHPEVRKARIVVKGAIRPNKKGFSLVKNIIKLTYYTLREAPTLTGSPYAVVDNKDSHYGERIISSKDKISVVRDNGFGFYHNIINLSKDWVVLILEKELNLRRHILLEQLVSELNTKESLVFKLYFNQVLEKGDKIFKTNLKLINKLIALKSPSIINSLILSLNINETGNHEPCTIFATVLKIGKKDRRVLQYLNEALLGKAAPPYYLKELINKLGT